MKQTILLVAFFRFFLPISQAQIQDCDCAEQFDFLEEKILNNYSGLKDKLSTETQADYDSHTAQHRKLSIETKVDTSCFRLLESWVSWFKDQHIQLSFEEQGQDTATIRAKFADWETIPITEADFKKKIDTETHSPLEGIWELGSNYRCAILSAPTPERDFVGVILRADSVWWMPGQVKFSLQKNKTNTNYNARFYMRNHAEKKVEAILKEGRLDFSGLGTWKRVYPNPAPATKQVKQQIYSLNRLDDKTLLLRIPTMDENYYKDFKELIKTNKQLLKTTPNLIIDCRDNGGGSDITYFPLRPFIYTQAVSYYHGQIYATPENEQKYIDWSKDKNYPFWMRWYGGLKARKLRKNYGEYIGKSGKITSKMWRKHKSPQQIAVLINGNCASSCESFVWFAEQSKKVTLFGQNTAGISDYGNLHNINFPNQRWELYYPTSRTSAIDFGKGIDNVGIPPDVRLDENIDWVEAVQMHWAKQ